MAFPIIGGSQSGGYLINNSLRLNSGDDAQLDKTFSSAGDLDKSTVSMWIKISNLASTPNAANYPFIARNSSDHQMAIRIRNTDVLQWYYYNGSYTMNLTTNRVLRDPSAWYHIVAVYDSENSTEAHRARLYVNGVEETSFSANVYPSQNTDGILGNNIAHSIGGYPTSGSQFDGCIAEMHYVNGSVKTPTDFGEFDEDSGIWKPIEYTGTYGTNGFYLDFENSGSLGADQSGNGNNFTPTNLASTDQITDTPTNNFATLNAVSQGTLATLSEGNLKYTNPSVNSGDLVRVSTQAFSTGKWYAEFYRVGGNLIVGIQKSDYDNSNKKLGEDAEGYGFFVDGRKVNNNTFTSYGSSYGVGDVVGIAYDADLGTLAFYVNGVSQGNAFTGLSGEFVFATGNNSTSATNGIFNFGQDSSFAGNETRQNNSDGNGFGDFYYTPPSGYLALCTQNLATELSPTIDDGSQYFNTVLYTGNGSTQSITGVGFQPDFVWIKERSSTSNHVAQDSTRGSSSALFPSLSNAESSTGNFVTSFDTDGFTSGNNGGTNESSQTYVAWNWKANGGTTSSNTDGSITSTVQANTTAGFSIVTYTGNGGTNVSVGHGLSSTPDLIILKDRDNTSDWYVYTTKIDGTLDFLDLNNSGTKNDSGASLPTSSVFYATGTVANSSGDNKIAYCFNNIEGYSKFGSYTGNGSSDGTFVYTGFRPAWVIVKRTDSTGNWGIYDNKRLGYNVDNNPLYADVSDAEGTSDVRDLLSNGFKQRNTGGGDNASGGTFIYMAFAENPFVTSGATPVTAR